MISIPAAKTLFFIALTLNPSHPQKIFVTSNSETYIWTHTVKGWSFEARGFPASDFSREPNQSEEVVTPPMADDLEGPLKNVRHHDWSHDSVMIFDNGDRVEKYKDAEFLILNAGGANQKTYTILCDDQIVSKYK
jgi:hypothetical protein